VGLDSQETYKQVIIVSLSPTLVEEGHALNFMPLYTKADVDDIFLYQSRLAKSRHAMVYSMLYLEGVIFGLRVSWRWVWGWWREGGSCGVGLARDI